MSGLPPDIVNKVLKDVTKNISNTVSMQATEALQQGVPWGHVIEELIKMAPASAGMNQANNMTGPGGQPPNDPSGMGGKGGGQPPQGPGVNKKEEMQAPASSSNNQGSLGLGQLLAGGGTPQAAAPQVTPQQPQQQQAAQGQPNFLSQFMGNLGYIASGGVEDRRALKQQQIAMNEQKLTGTEPIQPKDKLAQDIEIYKADASRSASLMTALQSAGQHYGDEFTKATTDYPKQFQAYANLNSLINAPFNPANDFAIAYEFVKFNDPTAVKEGERYDVQKIAPILDKALQAVQFKGKVFNGQTLTPGAKKAIQQAILTKKKSLDRGYNSFVKAYSKPLESRGLNPKDFLVGASLNEATNPSKGTEEGQLTTPSGTPYRRIN